MASRVLINKQTSARQTTFEVAWTAGSANGHYFNNQGDVLLLIKNDSVSSVTATIATPKTIDGLALADLAVAVAAGEVAVVGPFPVATYEQSYTDEEDPPVTHLRSVLVDLSAAADVSLSAIRVGD